MRSFRGVDVGRLALTLLVTACLACQGESGKIGLIDPSPSGYKEVSRFEIQPSGESWGPAGSLWTVPAIADGRLYLRDQDNLYAYDIKR